MEPIPGYDFKNVGNKAGGSECTYRLHLAVRLTVPKLSLTMTYAKKIVLPAVRKY